MCARGPAKRLPSRMSSHPIARGVQGRGCSPISCLPSTACTCRQSSERDLPARRRRDARRTGRLCGNPDAAARRDPSHVFTAERILRTIRQCQSWKDKTRTGRLWISVRDDRPFVEPDPRAAVFLHSPDLGCTHPDQHLAGCAGLMQADACAGFGRLYERNRKGCPVIEAACAGQGQVLRRPAAQQGADRSRGGQAHRRYVRDRT